MAITSTKRSPRTPSPCKTVRTFLPPGVSRPEEMVRLAPQQTDQTVQPISHSEPVCPSASPLERLLMSRMSGYLSDDSDMEPSPCPVRTQPTPVALGRRQRPTNQQVARKLNSAERDRKGYGIPRDPTAPTKREVMRALFRRNNIVSRQDLAVWYGQIVDGGEFYNIVRESCHNHWHSHEHREAAQSSVRKLIIDLLGRI
jgi:hypothetical protein